MNYHKTASKIITSCAVALLAIPQLAFAWDITSFQSDITIEKNSKIIVTETIVANYTNDPHHGIIRFIPINYKDSFGNNLSLDLNLLSITDERGNDWNYQESYSGNNIQYKVGDADIMIDQPATFVIKYEMDGAITYFKDHDELYWNLTGNEWDAPIKKAGSIITLPAGIPSDKIQTTCFTGRTGSTEKNCTTSVNANTVKIATTLPRGDAFALDVNEGLTGVIGFPKGILAEPTQSQKLTRFLKENWGFGLPVVTFFFLFYLWYTKGRDPENIRNTIMPTFTPPDNLSPAEIGTIVDEKVDMKDITASIIDLAVKGYIQIVEKKEKKFLFETTDYEFKKLKGKFDGSEKGFQKGLTSHEEILMDAIFGYSDSCKLSDLKNKFYKKLPDIKKEIYTQTVKKGYFLKNPDTVRNAYLIGGSSIIFIAVFGSAFVLNFGSIGLFVGLVISGVIMMIFSRFMPAKTKKGAECHYQILGLKEYINTAEKDRLEFQERISMFEKLLPYAMVLGVAEKWTKSFEGIYKNPPNWYSSNDPHFMNNFSTYYLFSRINSASSDMNSTFRSSPNSAAGGGSGFSGGFSGGGFGGGGGSSW